MGHLCIDGSRTALYSIVDMVVILILPGLSWVVGSSRSYFVFHSSIFRLRDVASLVGCPASCTALSPPAAERVRLERLTAPAEETTTSAPLSINTGSEPRWHSGYIIS